MWVPTNPFWSFLFGLFFLCRFSAFGILSLPECCTAFSILPVNTPGCQEKLTMLKWGENKLRVMMK
ncbi:hypothetical protein, partial [Enterocloster bolteae]|uniref:hypothetical protein n=1 Tax=Enterocloster bolteae TaxID=208479 RepID=UPI002A81465F